MLGGLEKWFKKWCVGVQNIVPYKFCEGRVYNILHSIFQGLAFGCSYRNPLMRALIVVNYMSMIQKVWSCRNILHYAWFNVECLEAKRWLRRKFVLYRRTTMQFVSSQSHVMRMPSACICSRTVLHMYKLQHGISKKKEHNANSNIVSQIPEILQGSNSSITRSKFRDYKVQTNIVN